MALTDYARLGIIYSGNALAQITSVGMTTNSGQQRVDTLIEGLAGFTPGSGDVTVDIGFVIPIGGPEATFQQDCANGTLLDVEFFVGALTYVGRGKVMTCSINQSVNASAEGTCQWMGQLKAIEA